MPTLPITASLALFALSLAGPEPAQVQERVLKDSDLKKLGGSITKYVEARKENEDVVLAEEDVKEEIEKLEKKLKDKADELLASPGDVGYAFWLSYEYEKQRVKKGKIEDLEFTDGFFSEDQPLLYALWAPSKYSARQGAYPVIITIPDSGVDPKQHLIERWQSNDIKDNVILAAPKMPGKIGEWTETGTAESPGGIARVISLIRAVGDQYAVDFDRIYLAGRGAGVPAAVAIGELFPDRFAGIIGRTGDSGETPADNFGSLPTFFAGGGSQVTAFQARVAELGFENCTVDATGLEEDIWKWIQAHPRNPYPDEVTFYPRKRFATRFYWLRIPPIEESVAARVHAKIDKDTNTITIEGKGITDVSLYFNDALVDMSKPIKVIANGQEYLDTIPRSAKTTLDLFYNAGTDPGKVFVATKSYHLPTIAAPDEGEGEGK